MKAIPHSYMLSLGKEEKSAIALGIRNSISSGKLSPDEPGTMARALEILAKLDNISFVVTGWDAEYILLPALNAIPVKMLSGDLLSGIYNMSKHKA